MSDLARGGGSYQNRARFIELFGQKLSLWPDASSLRVRDVKKQSVWTHTLQEHNLQHRYAPKSAIFDHKSAKNGHFCQKLSFLATKYQCLPLISMFWVQVVSWCSRYPILRVLNSKKDVSHAIEAISQLFQGHQHHKNTIFCPKMAKECQLWPKSVFCWVWVVIWCPCCPILRCWSQRKRGVACR